MEIKQIYNDGGRHKYFKGSARDCTVRAIAIFFKRDYLEVYNELYARSKEFYKRRGIKRYASPRAGVFTEVFEEYLRSLGLEKIEVNSVFNIPMKGSYIISFDNHVAAYVDGKIYDTYNPLEIKRNITKKVDYWQRPSSVERIENIDIDVRRKAFEYSFRKGLIPNMNILAKQIL